jgi:hypothetical protein
VSETAREIALETERVYYLPVCALCASSQIVSTEEDSWCEECKEWMSAETISLCVFPAGGKDQ